MSPAWLPSGRWLAGHDPVAGVAVEVVPVVEAAYLRDHTLMALERLVEARHELGAARLVLLAPDTRVVRDVLAGARVAGLVVELRAQPREDSPALPMVV